MTTSRIGRGALVTLAGAAASMAGAAGAANACEKPPPTNCSVDRDDVQYAPASSDGKGIVGQWENARGPHHQYKALGDEPVYGIQVRLNPDLVSDACKGSVDVSLASYTATGGTWETSGTQAFVGHTQTIPSLSAANREELLKVALPGSAGGPCYGQLDLYFGTKVYDGKPGNGALPHYNDSPTPDVHDMITGWNGADAAGSCVVTPPVTPSSPTTPTTPPTTPTTPTSPTTHPSTPTATPTTPKPPSSTGTTPPSTPPTTTATPGTPTLAHTGANVGEASLVALAFFGAGGTAMFASRKAKAAEARKH